MTSKVESLELEITSSDERLALALRRKHDNENKMKREHERTTIQLNEKRNEIEKLKENMETYQQTVKDQKEEKIQVEQQKLNAKKNETQEAHQLELEKIKKMNKIVIEKLKNENNKLNQQQEELVANAVNVAVVAEAKKLRIQHDETCMAMETTHSNEIHEQLATTTRILEEKYAIQLERLEHKHTEDFDAIKKTYDKMNENIKMENQTNANKIQLKEKDMKKAAKEIANAALDLSAQAQA